MQSYHQGKLKDAQDLKDKLNHTTEQHSELSMQYDELKQQLNDEKLQKEDILQELERYKVYLPEAEGLLQEVNERHKGAYEEIKIQQKELQDYKHVVDQYESEILELNKNLKS